MCLGDRAHQCYTLTEVKQPAVVALHLGTATSVLSEVPALATLGIALPAWERAATVR